MPGVSASVAIEYNSFLGNPAIFSWIIGKSGLRGKRKTAG
jgi:hypothetical protein